MVKKAVLVIIGIVIATIIGGIAIFTYSENAVQEIQTETEDNEGKVINLRLGEAASMGDGP